MKFVLILTITLAICGGIWADTKVLHNINIYDGEASRNEKISLKNADTADEELVIEGTYRQKFYPTNVNIGPYRLIAIYVADKDGYHVKYTLEGVAGLAATIPPLAISASALKSLAG